MKKLVTMKVSEELFFKLLELKGRLKCKTWEELYEKILRDYSGKRS